MATSPLSVSHFFLPVGLMAMLVEQLGQGRPARQPSVPLPQGAVDALPGLLRAPGIGPVPACGRRPVRCWWALAQATLCFTVSGGRWERLPISPPLGLRSVAGANGAFGRVPGSDVSSAIFASRPNHLLAPFASDEIDQPFLALRVHIEDDLGRVKGIRMEVGRVSTVGTVNTRIHRLALLGVFGVGLITGNG
jgi:hypothetical protein